MFFSNSSRPLSLFSFGSPRFKIEGIDLQILIEGKNHVFDVTFSLLVDEAFEAVQKGSRKMSHTPMPPMPNYPGNEGHESIENNLLMAEKILESISQPIATSERESSELVIDEQAQEVSEASTAIVPIQLEREETESKQPLGNRFGLLSKLKEQVQQKFSELKQEAQEKLPQLAVILAEFHQMRLVEPTRRWFVDRLTELKPELAKISNKILERGAEDIKKTLHVIRELPTTSRQMLVAFTCVKLLREFGGPQNAYEADGYAIYLESAKKVNVVDRLGNCVLRMELNRFGIPKIEHYDLSIADEATFVNAAFALRDSELVSNLYQLPKEEQENKLGLLAPHGTSKAISHMVQSDLLSQLEQILPSQDGSLEIAGGLYKITRNKENYTILRYAKGKAAEDIFVKLGGNVTNNLSPYDVSKIKEAITPIVEQLRQNQVSRQPSLNQRSSTESLRPKAVKEMER